MSVAISVCKEGLAGRISLNTKNGINLLGLEAVCEIATALERWRKCDSVQLVVIDHADGGKGFCAGADYPELSKLSRSLSRESVKVLKNQYRLASLIAYYPKPIITIMDGVVAGLGLSIAALSPYQVATERTVASMPATALGMIPDAGAAWVLPRMPGELGAWLALTGEELVGRSLLRAGLASHYCAHADLTVLKQDLCNRGIHALAEFAEQPKAIELDDDCLPWDRFNKINELFAGNDIFAIIERLKTGDDWSFSQATKIMAKSPLSTKLALRLLRTGQFLSSVRDALRIEYRISSRLIYTQNFHEGVRARMEDKDHCPFWQPESLRFVTVDSVSSYFTPLDTAELCLGVPPKSVSRRPDRVLEAI